VVADKRAAEFAKNAMAHAEPKEERKRREQKPLRAATGREAVTALIERSQAGDKGALYTGWQTVDMTLEQPVLPGEIIMLAARTGVGKTWAITTIMARALRGDAEARALLLSLEMSDVQIALRLAAHALDQRPNPVREDMRDGLTTTDDVMKRAPELDRLLIVDSSVPVGRVGEAITLTAERLGAAPAWVAVDYFGLIGWAGPGNASRYERVSENATQLKDVAKEHQVVVLTAVQLSRLGGGSGDKEPTLDALRDSGVAEEAADRIIAFWRPKDDDDWRLAGSTIHSKVIKNRFGPVSYDPVALRYTDSLILIEEGPVSQKPDYTIKGEEDKWWDR
jgi:replicative DNA helicase